MRGAIRYFLGVVLAVLIAATLDARLQDLLNLQKVQTLEAMRRNEILLFQAKQFKRMADILELPNPGCSEVPPAPPSDVEPEGYRLPDPRFPFPQVAELP